jgi:hypothetical protein
MPEENSDTFISPVVIGTGCVVLCFQEIGPTLKRKADDDATLIVEATSADFPMAKLSFKAEATDIVVSALKEALR